MVFKLDWNEKLIQENSKGGKEAFKRAYEISIIEGRKETISWEDLSLSSKVFPELEQLGKELIEERLGYLPHKKITIHFEPYLRALIKRYQCGDFEIDTLYDLADEQIRLIRNLDMKPNSCLEYDPLIYQNYYETFVPYGQKVKDRLSIFLRYEPQLEYSLVAEMWLREIMAMDTLVLPSYITAIDFKAITLIKYREFLLSQGQAAADQSPIVCGT